MGGVWGARFAVVHGEGPESCTVLGCDRRGPASAKAVRQRQVAIVGPERVGGDVGDHYRLLRVCRGAERPATGPNGGTIDRSTVFPRETGSRRSAQSDAVRLKKKHRAEKTCMLLLDFRTQDTQN